MGCMIEMKFVDYFNSICKCYFIIEANRRKTLAPISKSSLNSLVMKEEI